MEEYKQRTMKRDRGKKDDTVRKAVSKKKGIKPLRRERKTTPKRWMEHCQSAPTKARISFTRINKAGEKKVTRPSLRNARSKRWIER